MFIDHTQYNAFQKCEYYWYEQYCEQYTKTPAEGYIDTPLTLGICVHAGLEQLRKSGQAEIPQQVIDSSRVSPDYANWARVLCKGYTLHYPGEDQEVYACEEPLRFPIDAEGIEGLAKVDYYWKTPPGGQEISDGLGGSLHLEEGWWIKEYKTKNPSKNLGQWILSWRVAPQADFQCLALAAKLPPGEKVRGLILDTIEKPKPYIPQRTCKGCKAKQDMRMFEPTGDGQWKCPLCGHLQKLDTSDKSKADRTPAYYRVKVERSSEQLELTHGEISRIAKQMKDMKDGVDVPLRRLRECVPYIGKQCEYFEPHSMLKTAEGWPGFVKLDTLRYAQAEEQSDD